MTEPSFEVAARAGEPTALPVGGTAATGHEWTLERPPEVQLVGGTSATPAAHGANGPPGLPGPNAAGDPTQQRLVVVAPAGRYELTARLGRPWEDVPVRTVRIVLVVSE